MPTLETHTIAGSIAVPASEVIDEEWTNACVAAPGYRDDIGHLKPVVLQDESGTIIGTGVLVLDASKYPPNGWSKADRNCHFTFAFLNAPNANFYTIGTGGIRKGITLSREELRATDWFVELSLG